MPLHPTAPSTPARVRGCLLGTAVGDALGWPVEFLRLDEIRARYGPDGIQDFDPHAPGGRGAVTDDTQMTLFTAEGILRSTARHVARGDAPAMSWATRGDGRHTFDPDVMWNAYRRWLATQDERPESHGDAGGHTGWLFGVRALHHRRAPGNTCLSALRAGRVPPRAGRGDGPAYRAPNDSKGCGGVMRVAPVGCVPCGGAFAYAAAAAALTHGHPSGYLSAGAYAHVLQGIIRDGLPLHAAVGGAIARVRQESGHQETTRALARALSLADESEPPTAERLGTLGQGWTGEEALAVGVYAALAARDFAHGVRLAVNHSGDSDSTGSIAGGLLGAALGGDAIPARWRDAVELRGELRAAADDLAAGYGGGRVWHERYPPD